MVIGGCVGAGAGVALRKESVDRNTFCLAAGNQVVYSRSPQGERG